jgi:predicted protein tyrosine phosphatase
MKIYTLAKADIPDCDEKLNIPVQEKKAYILSIVDPGDKPPRRPVNIPAINHKVIHFNDIEDPFPAYNAVTPNKEHIQDLIYWFNEIKKDADFLIVHCFAGVSRSTAVTFLFHNLLLKAGNEEKALGAMLTSAVFGGAKPNKRIVQLADEELDRHGRMVSVINGYYKELEICRKMNIKFGSIDHLFL